MDPLSDDFKYNRVFTFFENKEIYGIDLEGIEWSLTINSVDALNKFHAELPVN